MNKINRLALFALLLGMISGSIFIAPHLPAYAQDDEQEGILEEMGTLNSVGEGDTRVLSSNWQPLSANQQHTYHFDYEGDEQPISVWMNVVPADGAEFEIWTEDTLAELNGELNAGTEVEPVGTGASIQEGTGFTLWQGSSQGAETYYVIVNSGEAENAQYLLNITSPGLALTQTVASALTPVTSPITSAVTSAVTSPITASNTTSATQAVTSTVVITPADDETTTVTPTVNLNIATVTTNALNVRSGPSTDYSIILTVLNGTQLTVLGRNASNTWLNVEVQEGVEGWVTRTLTDYSGISVLAATPILTPTVVLTPTVAAETSVAPVPGENVELADANAQEALDNQWRVLSDGEIRWYTFQHQGGDLPVHIWMDVEPNEGAGFRILSEENAQAVMAGTAPDDVDNIGRGTPNPVEAGYLFWRGVFEEAGTFYVMVEQLGEGDVYYSIHAAGPGLARPAPAQ